MTRNILLFGSVILLTLLVLAGCSGDSATNPSIDSSGLRTVPQDGANAVGISDSLQMMFPEPIDTAHFHEWFYCIDGTMHDALADSLTGGTMGMGSRHEDSGAFYTRMHERMVNGAFQWNDARDSCVFVPGMPFMEDTEYVMHFRGDMTDDRGEGMHHMGNARFDDMVLRFRTRDGSE